MEATPASLLSLVSDDVAEDILDRLSSEEFTRLLLCGEKNLVTKLMNNVRQFSISVYNAHRSFPPFLHQLPKLRRLVVNTHQDADLGLINGSGCLLHLGSSNLEELVLNDGGKSQFTSNANFLRSLPRSVTDLQLPYATLDSDLLVLLPPTLTTLKVRRCKLRAQSSTPRFPKTLTSLSGYIPYADSRLDREPSLLSIDVLHSHRPIVPHLYPRQIEEFLHFREIHATLLPSILDHFPNLTSLKLKRTREGLDMLKSLPISVTSLCIHNDHRGEIDPSALAALPPRLKIFELAGVFVDQVWTDKHAEALPKSLTHLKIMSYTFQTALLPSGLRSLDASALSSPYDLNLLPFGLKNLRLNSRAEPNCVISDIVPGQLCVPPSLTRLDIVVTAPMVRGLGPLPPIEDVTLRSPYTGVDAVTWISLVSRLHAPSLRRLSLDSSTSFVLPKERAIPVTECLEILREATQPKSHEELSNYDLFLRSLQFSRPARDPVTWAHLLPFQLECLEMNAYNWKSNAVLSMLPRTLSILKPRPPEIPFNPHWPTKLRTDLPMYHSEDFSAWKEISRSRDNLQPPHFNGSVSDEAALQSV